MPMTYEERTELHEAYKEARDRLQIILSDCRKYGDEIDQEEWLFWFNELDKRGEAYLDSLK